MKIEKKSFQSNLACVKKKRPSAKEKIFWKWNTHDANISSFLLGICSYLKPSPKEDACRVRRGAIESRWLRWHEAGATSQGVSTGFGFEISDTQVCTITYLCHYKPLSQQQLVIAAIEDSYKRCYWQLDTWVVKCPEIHQQWLIGKTLSQQGNNSPVKKCSQLFRNICFSLPMTREGMGM